MKLSLCLVSVLFVNLIAMSVFAASKTIDCTDKTVQSKHPKLCKAVIDPSKFPHEPFATVDCTAAQLENDYATKLCKKVDPKAQKKIRTEHSSK
jgi:hypothetical protein